MSASARTIQQPLGTGQIWAALAVVTVALAITVVIAFGSRSAPVEITPSAVGAPPPAVIDHGWSQAGTSTGTDAGAPPAVIDHGWSKAGTSTGSSAPPAVIDHGSSESSMGVTAPASDDSAGNTGRRLRPQ